MGNILLAGDIGSGKSTILLAIEFALFGLRRDVSGNSLLRNGVSKGSIELKFSINDKEIIIKRVLKRAKTSVTQDSGYIVINGEKRELTTVEIKQMVLDLLKYPQDLLGKSKDLIYRYTVYTPQEEMKYILFTDNESRLDILRRVFGIDKYKRIIENSEIYISHLKEKKNYNSSLIKDLDEKVDKRKNKEKEIREFEDKILKIKPDLDKIKEDIVIIKENIKLYENKILLLNSSKKDLEINEMELRNKLRSKKDNQEEVEDLEKYIKELREELKENHISADIKEEVGLKTNEVKFMENTIKEIIIKIRENEIKKNVSEDVKKKISILDNCPLCKQNVSKDHKYNIISTEDTNQGIFNINIKNLKEKEKEAEEKLKKLREELELLKKKENSIEIYNIKVTALKEKEEKRNRLLKVNEEIKRNVGEINISKEKIQKEIDSLKNVEREFNKVKEELEAMKDKEKNVELKIMGYEKEMEGIKREYDSLIKEVEGKLKLKEELTKIIKMQDWIENNFINLVEVIEKQIMTKVHSDFGSYFEKWFNVLIDNEVIKISLDNEFTPLISQNGHDMEYSYLSGGEKTAAALAYRLALNQVINNISHIKTKDIIILDEPTDGFSSEQLDRIRIILDDLKMKQIIIVSHDPKIEGFVDTIIRLDKKEHVTNIL